MKTFKEFLFEEEKGSKTTAKYQNQPKGSEKCSNCNMWRAPNGCTSVKGKIHQMVGVNGMPEIGRTKNEDL